MKKHLASVSAFFAASIFLIPASQSQAQFFNPFPEPETPSIQTRWEIILPLMHLQYDEFAGFSEFKARMNFDFNNITDEDLPSSGNLIDIPTDASLWETSTNSNGVNGNAAQTLYLRPNSSNPVQFKYAFQFEFANPTLPGTIDDSGVVHFVEHNEFGVSNPTSVTAGAIGYYEDYNYPGWWSGGTYRGTMAWLTLSFDQITGKTQLTTWDGVVIYEETVTMNDAGQFTIFGVSFDIERKKAIFPILESNSFWNFEADEQDFLFLSEVF